MKNLSFSGNQRRFILGTLALAAMAGIAWLCSGSAQAKPPAGPPPAVPVMVQTIVPTHARIWSSFSGRMKAVDAADIRPEVSGKIVDIKFKDGQLVSAGDVLVVIDPQPYEAAVAKAEANLASAKSNASFAQMELGRAKNLIKSQAIAKRLYDERATASRTTQDSIKVSEAELKQAHIDLDHAYVKAPISGRVGRAEITIGNLVQAGANAPLLTSIVSNNGIYADFEVDEQTYMKSIHAHADTKDKEQMIPVEATVSGDEAHPYKGTIYTFDNQINPGSGTIRARAKFDNEDGRLLPGMFVSVKMASDDGGEVLLAPERAIGSDQNKKFVYVVGDGNKVAYREVTLGQQTEGQRIVLTGLLPNERVIVEGVQHVKPDQVVDPKEAPPASETQADKPQDKPPQDKSSTDQPAAK